MKGSGVGMIQYLEGFTLDQILDQDECRDKRCKWCYKRRKRHAGNHDDEL